MQLKNMLPCRFVPCCGWLKGDFLFIYCSASRTTLPIGARAFDGGVWPAEDSGLCCFLYLSIYLIHCPPERVCEFLLIKDEVFKGSQLLPFFGKDYVHTSTLT